ncbi:MAG: FMN-binding protein [Anaerolineaceae bacterium]|nr:FMN-binding protein [Anaerolineaceae bacterium]
MIFIIALAAALTFTIAFSALLRKHPVPFYAAAVMISILIVYCTWQHAAFPGWFETWVWPVFARGALAGAMFVLVMCTGALPNGSAAMKMFMPVRANLSIIACILTLGHNIAYGKTYFNALFFEPSRLSTPTLLAAICSLIMIIIMLPLFITSFRTVRKMMEAKNWKRLQRWAYLFYGLLYCHIMLLAVPNAINGRAGYALTVFVYSLVFLSYLICRVMKAVAVHEKTTNTLILKQSGGIIVGTVMACLILIAVNSTKNAVYAREALATLQTSNAASSLAETTHPETLPDEDESNISSDEKNTSPEDAAVTGKYKDGIYSGSAKGNHGTRKDVEVSVSIENDTILSIELTGFRDDEEYFSPSIEGAAMIGEMLEKQSPFVDVISGATESSEGLIRAVSSALNLARNQ